MFIGHNPGLVLLSIAVAVLGGYTGFGLASRIRQTDNSHRRVLLVGAAAFLSVGIWTMHFIGMLAAPIPQDAAYLVLPTIVSFLICALVVGISLFLVSGARTGPFRLVASAFLMGVGISSMHYVGIHGLAGHFSIIHNPEMVGLSVVIAIATAYGGLSIYLTRQDGIRLAVCALAFGIAVSGMHYTAMAGMQFVDPAEGHSMASMGPALVASPQILSLIIAFLCFVIAAGFLLFLMPEQWGQAEANGGMAAEEASPAPPLDSPAEQNPANDDPPIAQNSPPAVEAQAQAATIMTRIPVQSANTTQFVDMGDIRSIRADAHYTWVHDGNRERMCSLPISEAETVLDKAAFMRVHRSYIVALAHVNLMRKEGDGAVIELDGTHPHLIPVSRSKMAEVRARLGVAKRPNQR
jgi:NO-binding membrane sensor protein with MHYT domain